MKIPKRFKLFGQTIEVDIQENLNDKTDCRGQTKYRENKIYLQAIDGKYYSRPTTSIEQTFCHELTHWILFLMHEKIEEDEKFIEVFSNLFHQALTTFEYEDKNKIEGK